MRSKILYTDAQELFGHIDEATSLEIRKQIGLKPFKNKGGAPLLIAMRGSDMLYIYPDAHPEHTASRIKSHLAEGESVDCYHANTDEFLAYYSDVMDSRGVIV